MDRTRAFVIALLLCCLVAVGGVVASDSGTEPQTDDEPERSMTVVTVENSSEYLTPRSGAVDRSGERTTGIDVSGAIEADVGQFRSVYLLESIQRQYRNAETDAERADVLERGAERLSGRVDTIERKERAAIREFSAGQRNSGGLLRTLATVHREADATAESLEWIEERADEIGADGTAQRAATDRVRLVPMGGPTRAQLERAIEGESTPRAYVETAGDGVVVATMDPDSETYLREAHDPTAKRADVPDQYDGNPSPALDRFSELYPWAVQSFDAIDAIGPAQVRLYRFGADHPHGELETYLDSGSTEILHERQRIDPEAMPTTTLEGTDGDLRVVLNTTRAGGPLGVALVDTTSGERVDGTVELNGERVGSTGDGRLWTIAPRGQTTINATHAGETVAVETRFD